MPNDDRSYISDTSLFLGALGYHLLFILFVGGPWRQSLFVLVVALWLTLVYYFSGLLIILGPPAHYREIQKSRLVSRIKEEETLKVSLLSDT